MTAKTTRGPDLKPRALAGRKNSKNRLAVQMFKRAMDVTHEHKFVQLKSDAFELIHVPTMARYKFVAGSRKTKSGQVSPYKRTSVMVKGRRRTLYLHRLICALFNGPAPKGSITDHIDRNKKNNSPDNLRWASRSENNLNSDRCELAAKKREIEAKKKEQRAQMRLASARNRLANVISRTYKSHPQVAE